MNYNCIVNISYLNSSTSVRCVFIRILHNTSLFFKQTKPTRTQRCVLVLISFGFLIYRIGGTVGAVLTCPLEVVKTRLQSSCASFQPVYLQTVTANNVGLVTTSNVNYNAYVQNKVHPTVHSGTLAAEQALQIAQSRSVGLYFCLRYDMLN